MRTSRPTTKPAVANAFKKGVRKAPSTSGERLLKYPITGIFFCACAASGQVAIPPATTLRRSRRLIIAPEAQTHDVSKLPQRSGGVDVRFGSKAHMCVAKSDVCFNPNSDREHEQACLRRERLPHC